MRKLKAGVKSGRLANGMERGKGRVVHAIDGQYSLCGQSPAISWSEREMSEISCPRCIKKLRHELAVSNAINQIDQMITEEDV